MRSSCGKECRRLCRSRGMPQYEKKNSDLLRSSAAGNQTLDASLFYEPLARVFLQPKGPALLAGGVTGLLDGDGRLAETELFKLLAGSLNAASTQVGDQTAFLIGLLRACRELAWRQPALVEAVEK